MFKKETQEQKDAKEAARLADAENLRLRQDRAAGEQAAAARAKELKKFMASSPGRARSAYERGDHIYQLVLDVKNTKASVIAMTGAFTNTTSTDPSDLLNAVSREGWELVNGSFVFHELGSESRDKFLASGQNVAVKGSIIGYYLFRRQPANRHVTAHELELTEGASAEAEAPAFPVG